MLPKQCDFVMTKAKIIVMNNNIFLFLFYSKFDVAARFEKEEAGCEKPVNIF